MGIELKKVKCYPKLSQETEAFSAELWDEGKHVAYVSNNGEGGCNRYQPVNGFTTNDVDNLEGKYNIDLDEEIIVMVVEIDETRKKEKDGFFMKSKDGKYYTSKFPKPLSKMKKANTYLSWVTLQKKIFERQGLTVLNTNL